MEKLPLVKYCKLSNFQISNFSSFRATSSRYAWPHISKGFPSSFFLSFHTFFPCFCSQSFASFYFVLCFFLRFSFSLFYSYWQFSCPDESPVRWRLDRLDRHSLNTTRSRWAGKFAGKFQLGNAVEKYRNRFGKYSKRYSWEMQLTNTFEKYNWKIHSRNAVDKYSWELQQ